MHSPSNEELIIHIPWRIDIKPEDDFLFKKCLTEENTPGIVKIDLVETTDFRVKDLSEGAKKMCEPGVNAGGGSEISEAVSYEIFHTQKGAELLMTEKDIENHMKNQPIIDYICKISGKMVGVSVTRAMKNSENFTENYATQFLKEKMSKIEVATDKQKDIRGLFPKWEMKILHVMAQNEVMAKMVSKAANKLLKEYRYEILVVISNAEVLEPIFTNDIDMLSQTPKREALEGTSCTIEANKARKRKTQEQETPQKAKKQKRKS